ncbi:unnamed protein product [Bursaphelenchus xylophilus]|uniref:(pine wood nematode) hypothetical protein n=1 Tax=Bursaphelenchus xylophilus TaxID=6326 RepID=A0A7I8XJD5_BURXY|nr:unnamed protein product [Bursaphelenchus xylophilus]CAG9125229.1 unnamed protein product [Bursaphelenchus xylophilus]
MRLLCSLILVILLVDFAVASYDCYRGEEQDGSMTPAYCAKTSNGCLKFVGFDGVRVSRDCARPDECVDRTQKVIPRNTGTVYCCWSNWCNSSPVMSASLLLIFSAYFLLN